MQNLLLVAPPMLEQPIWESGRWDWSTVVCFSCGKPGHRQRGLEAVLLCSHPGFWLNDIGQKTATDPGTSRSSPGV